MRLPDSVKRANGQTSDRPNRIMHIGVGGFHRAHQAFALNKLIEQDPDAYSCWRITGVGLLPSDRKIIENFRAQDGLYTLKAVAYDGSEELQLIGSIKEMLHADGDAAEIIHKISDPHTSLITFTITEGGYNYDFEQQRFRMENTEIQTDLRHPEEPKTVFGFLAKGLQLRQQTGGGPLTLLSCDNILENGTILQAALLAFLQAYDPALGNWVEQHVDFPNSMVDRITPAPTEADRLEFAARYGVQDDCLVVCEDFFQWVIGASLNHPNMPPLSAVGVEFVADVAPFEEMKLGILNAGHSLVGLLGDALGYQRIHDAVVDSDIAAVFQHYARREAIPVLQPVSGLDLNGYVEKVRQRFSNPMINDSTARIISGSSDKFPKFILPILHQQLNAARPEVEASALVVAAWWAYLDREKKRNDLADVQDALTTVWRELFCREDSELQFIAYHPVFGTLQDSALFTDAYKRWIAVFKSGSLRDMLHQKFIKK